MEPRFDGAAWLRTAVVTGVLCAYTTFSTFSPDTYRLLGRGELDQAFANALGSIVLGLLAVWLGLGSGARCRATGAVRRLVRGRRR